MMPQRLDKALVAVAVLAVVGVLSLPVCLHARPGDLDLTFHADRGEATSIALDPQGRIVLGGLFGNNRSYSPAIVRLQPDGKLDRDFDGDGILFLSSPPSSEGRGEVVVRPVSVKIQSERQESRILSLERVGGCTLSRYHPNGDRDSSFGQNGQIATLQSCSDFIVGHQSIITVVATENNRLVLARYDRSGLPLGGFGTGGTVRHSTGGETPSYAKVVEQWDGKLVVAGSAFRQGKSRPVLIRILPTGGLDPSFRNDEVPAFASLDFAGYLAPDALALQNTGDGETRILIAGTYHCSKSSKRPGARSGCAYLARFNADGSIDHRFGRGGVIFPDATSSRGLAVQRDGKIVFIGEAGVVARYGTDGNPDMEFGSSGVVQATGVGGTQIHFLDLALDTSGRIVIAGYSIGPGPTRPTTLTVLRYLGN